VARDVASFLTGLTETDQALTDIRDAWSGLLRDVPFLVGELFEDLEMTGQRLTIAHGLKRPVTGWWLVRRGTPSSTPHTENIYDEQQDNPHPDRELWLNRAGSVVETLSVWVF